MGLLPLFAIVLMMIAIGMIAAYDRAARMLGMLAVAVVLAGVIAGLRMQIFGASMSDRGWIIAVDALVILLLTLGIPVLSGGLLAAWVKRRLGAIGGVILGWILGLAVLLIMGIRVIVFLTERGVQL